MINRNSDNYLRVIPNLMSRVTTGAALSLPTWAESRLPASHPLVRRLYFGKTPPPTSTVRIMTFNAERCFDGGQTEEQLRAKANVILQANPDVIALQEVGDKAFLEAFNRNYLNGEYPHILEEECSTVPYRVAYLGKQFVRLQGVPHCHERQLQHVRDFFEAKCSVGNYQWRMFNAHFRSMAWGERKSLGKRLQEATFASELLKRIFQKNPDEKVMVVGDLNSRADSEEGRQVLQRVSLADDPTSPIVLKEATQEMKKRQGLQQTWEPTFHSASRAYTDRLDYMYASPDLLRDMVDAKVLGSRNEWPYTIASQHLPILAVLKVPQAKSNTLFSGNSKKLNWIA